MTSGNALPHGQALQRDALAPAARTDHDERLPSGQRGTDQR
ncbi:hypothetical protein [Streptomyces griseocarneus]|nr:hypothetical protein [Streptomyces griseocarneus]